MTKVPSDFPPAMGKVAPRELAANGIRTLRQAAGYTEQELLALHGVGPKAVRILKEELARKKLSLKQSPQKQAKKPLRKTKGSATKATSGEAIAAGVVHSMPADVQATLASNQDVLEKWNGLTPLARNEWICWITIVKKQETRDEHIARLCEDLRNGKRRPCCWPGCPHRNAGAKKWFKNL